MNSVAGSRLLIGRPFTALRREYIIGVLCSVPGPVGPAKS